MIKVNELRVGNYFNNIHGGLGQIKNGEAIDKSEWYKPIPLTPELLITCGFEDFTHSQLPLWEMPNGFMIFENIYEGGNGYSVQLMGKFDVQLQYLHQLQNLYFALTGEDFKINLS